MQHNLQANSKYKKLKFFTYGSLLAFLKFVESVNCSYFPTLYKESCFFMQSLALLWIYLYLSHIQHYYLNLHDHCTSACMNRSSQNAGLQ